MGDSYAPLCAIVRLGHKGHTVPAKHFRHPIDIRHTQNQGYSVLSLDLPGIRCEVFKSSLIKFRLKIAMHNPLASKSA